MAWGKRSEGGGCLGKLALVLALLALALAWMAYRRTGGSLETLLKQPWEEARGSLGAEEERAARDEDEGIDLIAEARARLLERRGEVAGERNLKQVGADIQKIREDLRQTYEGASASTRERWRQVDGDLERLEAQVRQGSRQAVQTLDSTVERLKRWGGDER